MIRKFFHYQDLEEFKAGMWRIVRGEQRKINAKLAAELMADPARFSRAMDRALAEWPKSCEHNLTAENSNRIAWLGHAGCLLGVGSPEENTRLGWHMLTPIQQARANAAAQSVLDYWESVQVQDEQLELFGCH